MFLLKNNTKIGLILFTGFYSGIIWSAENNKIKTFYDPKLAKSIIKLDFFNANPSQSNDKNVVLHIPSFFFCSETLSYGNVFKLPDNVIDDFKYAVKENAFFKRTHNNLKVFSYIKKYEKDIFSERAINNLYAIATLVKEYNEKNSQKPYEFKTIDNNVIKMIANAYFFAYFLNEQEMFNNNLFPNNELYYFYKKCAQPYLQYLF